MPRRPPPPQPQPRMVEEAFAKMFSLGKDGDVKEIARISNMALKEKAVITEKKFVENKDGDHKMWIEWIEFTIKSPEQFENELDDEDIAAAAGQHPIYDADDLDALKDEDGAEVE